jgi:SAM-dependent methyltransferase
VPTRGEIAATFDAIAADFAATREHPWRETVDFVSRLAAKSRILDLGCGNGRNAAILRDAGHTVVGLDASRGLLSFFAAKLGTDRLVHGDAVALPFHDGSFDAVHAVATIHHMPSEAERRRLLKECDRVLRPGGLLLVSAWAAEQPRFREERSQDVHVPWKRSNGDEVVRFYHLFQEGELVRATTDAGFAIERAWREGDNYVVLAAKP